MGETQVGPQARREYLGRMRERYEQARSASVHVLRRLWMTPARARAGRREARKKGRHEGAPEGPPLHTGRAKVGGR